MLAQPNPHPSRMARNAAPSNLSGEPALLMIALAADSTKAVRNLPLSWKSTPPGSLWFDLLLELSCSWSRSDRPTNKKRICIQSRLGAVSWDLSSWLLAVCWPKMAEAAMQMRDLLQWPDPHPSPVIKWYACPETMGYKISIIKAKGQCSKKVQLSAEHSISGPGHRDSRAECQLGIFAGGFRKIKKNKPPKTKKRKKKKKSVYHKKQAASKVLHAFQSRAKSYVPRPLESA